MDLIENVNKSVHTMSSNKIYLIVKHTGVFIVVVNDPLYLLIVSGT